MINWANLTTTNPKQYVCGYCGRSVASNQAFFSNSSPQKFIYSCPNCNQPTYFDGQNQVPGVAPGNEVEHLPKEVAALYREARNAVSVSAHTAAVLACRKLLMHIAVEQGAKAGDSFLSYVDYLANKGFVPPNGRGWVDHIRNKGNEANHEIKLMGDKDAAELIAFLEMLLKFIYEFPNKVPAAKP